MSRPAEVAFDKLITAISDRLTTRITRARRAECVDLARFTPISSTTARPGSTQRGWFATRVGSASSIAIAATTAMVTCTRGSSRVTLRHAAPA